MTETLASALAVVRADGRKAFVPYVTGGLEGVDADLLLELGKTGAHGLEIGIPFSDPVMDGAVVQEASRLALEAGTTPGAALDLVRSARDRGFELPVAFMTYLNPMLAEGVDRFLDDAATCGVSAFIVPDLPVDEADEWVGACRARGIAPVLLAAPNSSEERLHRIAEEAEGFVYCVSTFGVTGSRDELSSSAESLVASLRPLTPTPLLIGVGISTPEQARAACAFADGVVVGSALMEPMLGGDRTEVLRRAEAFGEAVLEGA
ncbi:MAG TPA: tryptophan synthase subunit alpha [Actinomycetota bacterium]|nr:tryptophan synthase subunit alpha [Actinomycetota bacterium]